MRKWFSVAALLLATPIFFSSCLNDDDDTTTTTNGDCAISSFTLGSINRTLHATASDGSDSIYSVSYTGSYFQMNIDQQKGTIYNADSLLYGSDLTRVLVNISLASTASTVVYRNASDAADAQWTNYVATDSLDFTQPKTFRIYATDGTTYKDYTVTLNVHQQQGEAFTWTKRLTGNAMLSLLDKQKAVLFGGKMLVFGTSGGTLMVAESAAGDGQTWTLNSLATCPDGDAATLQTFKNQLYMSSNGGTLYTSADGLTWTVVSMGAITRLFAANSTLLYALQGATIVASPDGVVWTAETLDDTANLLPSQDIASISYPLSTNGKLEKTVLVGNRTPSVYTSDTSAVVWTKLYDTTGATTGVWTYYDVSSNNHTPCPMLDHLTLLQYDGHLMACGGNTLAAGQTETALDGLYVSRDNGITWPKSSDYLLPSELAGTTENFAVLTDSDNFIWIFCGGDVWRGRLNRLGFVNNQTAVTE